MTDDPTSAPQPKKPRKGGRPRLPADQKRTGKIAFSPTPEERAAILAKADAAGLSLADYCRAAALEAPLRVRQYREIDPYTRHQLAKIGANLNQLARHANAGRWPAYDALEAALQEVEKIIREVP